MSDAAGPTTARSPYRRKALGIGARGLGARGVTLTGEGLALPWCSTYQADVMFLRNAMKKLLLIANNARLAESVHNMAARARVAVTQITSCRVTNDFLMRGCDFDMVIIELRPCLSRLALLAEIQERFRGLPVLAVTSSDDACEQALACAYADCAPLRTADLDDGSLARHLGCESAPALSTSLKQRRIP